METVCEMRLVRWNRMALPASQAIRQALQAEGFSVSEWTDTPGKLYPVHTHPFAQAHVLASGHMRVGLPDTGEEITLNPGDRLDVPPDVPHWEEVSGNEATTYLAATRTPCNHASLEQTTEHSSTSG